MFKSITVKFFLLILAALVVLTGSLLFFQSYFFEDYYVSRKETTIRTRTIDLVSIYQKAKNPYTLETNQAIFQNSEMYNLEISFLGDPIPTAGETANGATTSIITANSLKTSLSGVTFYSDQMRKSEELYEKNKPEMDAGKIISYSIKNQFDIPYIITVSRIKTLDGTGGLLVVFATLQPVDEAAGVIRDYYLFFFACGLVISLALAYAISRQIARPLIHINTVASRISKLDFTQQCMVSGNDELSELAKTVNQLSENLSGALENLRETNSRLNTEIDHQKELDGLRKRFVAGVSHELKTPLSVIKGYAEGLIDNNRNGAVNKEYAGIIQDEVDHMEHIITDMLDLSQMEAGRYTLQLEPVAINRLLKYELHKIQPYLEKKELDLVQEIPEDQVIVNVDGRRIQQVISNLLNNAIRYTPRNGSIRVAVISIPGEIKIEVENTCPEYSETDLEHIWDDFYRLDPSHNRDSGGSGLGLSVVKSILELHNSDYGVEKTTTGLNFYFVLCNQQKQGEINLE